ncbi:DNA-directed RNA polymerase I subunit rpa1-like [Dorcoceras hygrometricum]|uniref:DNA-directed RNA polymerase subunit n=1 Tax=Dorcoceras hygrometricum TaxID=472368 RepID=A0A2Z7BPT7_9LAMI|nr:DNA-directed RNA polymerase I subunit rpa1-like [Dorcoceras hygrometricum]
MTDEEVKKHSVVKITNPDLLDILQRPIPGGLYDYALGPLHENSRCNTCGQRQYHCAGHCGHIDLVSPAYNPLLFNLLKIILNKTCFYCFHFRSTREEVENCISLLKLITKGDIVGAKKMSLIRKLQGKEKYDWILTLDTDEAEDRQGSCASHVSECYGSQNKYDHNKKTHWDSSLLTEAISVLNEFLKKRSKKCTNCGCDNPKISRPTFGWLHLGGLTDKQIRSNHILRSSLNVPYNGGEDDKHSSEVVNASECSGLDDSDTTEANSVIALSGSGENISKSHVNRKRSKNMGSEEERISKGPLLPSEVRDTLRRLWDNEAPLCSFICDIQQRSEQAKQIQGHYMFFLETILVPPIKFRPPAKGGDSVMEHPHTLLLGKVLQSNIALGNALVNDAERSKIIHRWMGLQQSINLLFDSKTASSQSQKDATSGICQLLEKKEGIFRQKMMGKRVNFACRSVISPDPYLAVNEIGIPPYFALRLTYPERVTPWNAAKLRGSVINGPEVHPGATVYIDSVATARLPPGNHKARLAISKKLPSSRGAVSQSGKNDDLEFEGKIVYRHLQDGDIVLVNRQPTLHKPSIMAHVVRVLKGEKTLRMHYANCSSYNADFDGDEINVHFPQDEISRAEAYNIVNANEQYIVPTRGDTVRGLIQDHIVSAVLLTMKNTFLTRSEFSQLLYGSGVFAGEPGILPGKHALKVSLVASEGVVDSVLPTVWKPEPLWTGKQVISALLNHITRGCAPCTVLVRGVIDKAQFGKFGLVHTVQELYGSNSAGILLSALSRLFTVFLQINGFTCGLDDLIILPHFDVQRREKLEGNDVGEEVHCDFVKFKPGQIGIEELQLEIEKALCSDRESATASLDVKMKNKLTNKLTGEGSQILKHLLTAGLLKPFPRNCISVMTTTGAKGSTVNFQQISAYLGQQELEGKRVPRMVSGKTLPSFPPWDFTSRAGGFITDRFLTGLRPQEYYFHCMAGREGLVDTAVKTSRSGYLQRCLIKNLESLKVCYDYTVRDADGSIIQFYYGEDGVDVHKTSFLRNFGALEDNQGPIFQKFQIEREFNAYIEKLPEGLEEEVNRYVEVTKRKSDRGKMNIGNKLHKRRKATNSKHLSDKLMTTVKKPDKLIDLVKQKYLSSLAQAGEPVGVIAAQSVGEPSTQMTLNTFHLAGRGEMNVTLGIPRLQEILMTASEVIRTPVLTCPFLQWRFKRDVVSLVSKVKKVTVADLLESMEVQLSFDHHEQARIYKLIIKLKDSEFVSLEDTHETLNSAFIKELDDAIENHIIFLSRMIGIKNLKSSSRAGELNEIDDDSGLGTQEKDGDGDGDGDDDYDGEQYAGDDLGSDVQKRKQQATDEMDYEDGSEVELDEHELLAEQGKGITDHDHLEDEETEDSENDSEGSDVPNEDKVVSAAKSNSKSRKMSKRVKKSTGKLPAEQGKGITDHDHLEDEETEDSENDNEGSNVPNEDKVVSAAKSNSKSRKMSKRVKKSTGTLSDMKIRRATYAAAEGLCFEVHFKFTVEPHLLLAQLAQKTAKKVYIKRAGKISQCKMVQYDADEKTVIWDDNKKQNSGDTGNPLTDGEDATAYWAVKAFGVDFKSFWEMHEDLDTSRLYSNNIHAMLQTYGVEAARATIIREVKQVFDIYGVKIDYRHLSLIADYMTHTGGYRSMSRHGGISESLSPFLKMSFETASKFIVEAASHGLTDDLETPSSRVCLGLPVKMGTGCFDLMQKLEA